MAAKPERRVQLGQVLTEARERVTVHPDRDYPIAGVYGFGRGILLRPRVRGSQLSAPHLYRIRARQIIYSRLKAFEGAFALVPHEADGRYVSNEFPTFDVDESKAIPEFIALVLRLPKSWQDLMERIRGVGARRERLQIRDFLDYEVDLPSLDQQRRVVASIGAADDVVRASLAEAEAARQLAEGLYLDLYGGPEWRVVRLADVCALEIEHVDVQADEEYRVAGVLIGGRGLFSRENIRGSDTNYVRLHRLRSNQLVYRKLTAWEGPITVVPLEFDGACVSPEFPTFTFDEAQLLPGFMRFVCGRTEFHLQMRARSTGTAERRNRLKPTDLLDIEIDLPPIHEQQKIANVFATAVAADREADVARTFATALLKRLLVKLGERAAA